MCHRTWAAMTAIAAVKRRRPCNYEQGQRSYERPLMQGDRIRVKEPHYQPRRQKNECHKLVTEITLWLSNDKEFGRNQNPPKNPRTSLPPFVA